MATKHRVPRPSSERVQDWIVSVINPICRGLAVEKRFLPGGPLFWIHTRRWFEYLNHLRDEVPVEFVENLTDFRRKQKEFAQLEERHDASLDALSVAVQAAFDRLTGASAVELRQHFEQARESFRLSKFQSAQISSKVDPSDYLYWASYIASLVSELGPRFSLGEFFNAHPQLRQEAAALARVELESVAASAQRHADCVEQTLDYLEALRTRLADEYHVRIKPVPTDHGAADYG